MSVTSYFKGLSWLVVLNLLIKPVWIFAIDRKVQLEVGHAAYGQYFACLALSYVLLFLADAGLSTLMNRRLAAGEPVPFRQYVRFKLFLLLLYGLATGFFGWAAGMERLDLLLYLIAIQGLTSFYVFLRGVVTAHQRFGADAVFSVIDKGLMILLCGALLYLPLSARLDLTLFLRIQTGCTALAVALIGAYLAEHRLLRSGESQGSGRLVPQLLPFAGVVLLMGIHWRIDGFLLERFHADGAREAGLYAAAYRLVDAGNMVGYLAASFLLPFVARHRNSEAQVQLAIRNTLHALMVPALALVLFAAFFSPWMARLLYDQTDTYLPRVLMLALAALPGYYLVQVWGTVLTATGRLQLFIFVLLASVLVNLSLNLLLIPGMGAEGSCYAALASQYVCGSGCWLVARRGSKVPARPSELLAYAGWTALLALWFWAGKWAGWDVWIILATAAILTAVFLAAQTGLLKKYFASLR